LLRDTLYLFFGLWGQIFEAKSQSHFWSSWRNSWNPEPLSIFNSRRRFCPCLTPSLKKCRDQKSFAHFGRFFLLIKIFILHTFQLQLHSTTWLDWPDMPRLGVDTKHFTWTVRGQPAYTADNVRGLSADSVRRCGRGFRGVYSMPLCRSDLSFRTETRWLKVPRWRQRWPQCC
jgi:hypothetical protein